MTLVEVGAVGVEEAVTMEVEMGAVEGVDSQARCLLLSPLRLIRTIR
jgi:hypothetical protein